MSEKLESIFFEEDLNFLCIVNTFLPLCTAHSKTKMPTSHDLIEEVLRYKKSCKKRTMLSQNSLLFGFTCSRLPNKRVTYLLVSVLFFLPLCPYFKISN